MNLTSALKGYDRVPGSQAQDSIDDQPKTNTESKTPNKVVAGLIVFLFVASFCFLLISIRFWRLAISQKSDERPIIVHSPALEAEEFQAIRFDGEINSENVYKGTPSPELDAAWKDLYEYEPFLVTSEELRKINKTSVQVPTRPGYHLARLAVHHQLHCLDYIRRFSRPEYYKIDESMFAITTIEHVDHCIDMLRQFLQCKADTTLITFDWAGHGSPTRPNFCSTHPCNNFEKVNEWAKSRQFDVATELQGYQNTIEEILRENGRLPPN